jgi:hypothetical protein
MYSKRGTYCHIKMFKSLPFNMVLKLQNDKPDFKVALQRYLITYTFYSHENFFSHSQAVSLNPNILTLSDPTSNLVRQYDFPVPLRCRKTSDTVFVAFVRPLSELVQCFLSCSTDFSQQIAQVVLFLFLYVFLF